MDSPFMDTYLRTLVMGTAFSNTFITIIMVSNMLAIVLYYAKYQVFCTTNFNYFIKSYQLNELLL